MLPSGDRWSKRTVSSRTDTLKSFAGPSAAQEAGSFITGNHKEKKRFEKKKKTPQNKHLCGCEERQTISWRFCEEESESEKQVHSRACF